MPVKSCNKDGKKGYKWGDSGKCYTYTPGDEASKKRAKDKATKQGRAIQVNKSSIINMKEWALDLREAADRLILATSLLNKKEKHIFLSLRGNIKTIHKSDGKKIIAGYASLAVVDSENDYIPVEVLKAGLSTLISDESYANIMIVHKNIQIGKILDKYGELETHVDDKGLFIVAEIRDDLEIAKKTWEKIENGEIRGFSIGGEIIENHEECDNDGCINVIDKINLFEISVCSCPINKDSGFEIVNKCDVSKMLDNCNDKMKKEKKDEPKVLEKDEDEDKEPCDDCKSEDIDKEKEPEIEQKTEEPDPEPVDILSKSDIIEVIKSTIEDVLRDIHDKELEKEDPEPEPEQEPPKEEDPPKEEEKAEDNEKVEETDTELQLAVKARDETIEALNEAVKELKDKVTSLEQTEESPKTSKEPEVKLNKDIGIIVDKRHGRIYKK